MRVFVTGGSGFTGLYLLSELRRRECEVIAFEGDITNSAEVRTALTAARPDRVVHLAAIAFIASDNFSAFYNVNQIGTFTLLAAVADIVPDAPVLLASSANIYGIGTAGYLTEDTPPNPANHYAVSKWAMEVGARLWMHQLKITITRPFNYTGVGQNEMFLIPKIVAHFRNRAAIIELGNMNVQRDFGDVRSVVEAYAALTIDPPAERIVNICTGHVSSIREILAICASIMGYSIEARVNPRFVRQNEVPVLAGDPSRLKTILRDWRPRAIEDTLRWMLKA